MYLVSPQELVVQHITELHQQAARQRLIHELRTSGARANTRRRWPRWGRLAFRPPRPARA